MRDQFKPLILLIYKIDCQANLHWWSNNGENRWSEIGRPWTKRMGATYVGVRRAHPYSWSLSSPQQPLETEDSPTVSLAPQYTSQRLCRARDDFLKLLVLLFLFGFAQIASPAHRPKVIPTHKSMKFFQ
jgi:hypothetical protein